MLPEIEIGGFRFYDIASIVTPNRYARAATDALLIHHSVGQTHFPDISGNNTNMDEEIAHIRAINRYHVDVGYGGFGYQAIVFESGRRYVVGDGAGARAHIAGLNHRYEGLCVAGTFTTAQMPFGAKLAAGIWVLAKFRQHGFKPVGGHREFARASDPTSCPGAGGIASIHDVLRVVEALARNG